MVRRLVLVFFDVVVSTSTVGNPLPLVNVCSVVIFAVIRRAVGFSTCVEVGFSVLFAVETTVVGAIVLAMVVGGVVVDGSGTVKEKNIY